MPNIFQANIQGKQRLKTYTNSNIFTQKWHNYVVFHFKVLNLRYYGKKKLHYDLIILLEVHNDSF